MKKLLVLFLLFSIAMVQLSSANAQIVNTKTGVTKTGVAKASLTNTDTAYINFDVDKTTESIQAWDTKQSGTVAGKIYLTATIEGTKWYRLDSLTRTDGANDKVFEIPTRKVYARYRLEWVQTGTALSNFRAHLVRRL